MKLIVFVGEQNTYVIKLLESNIEQKIVIHCIIPNEL